MKMELQYTYWQEGVFFVGFLNDYAELEEARIEVYEIKQEEKTSCRNPKNGKTASARMRREKLLEKAKEYDAVFVRHGKKHDIYENPRPHEYTQLPRYADINEYTAKEIIKKLSK
jgi:hypothetical protein